MVAVAVSGAGCVYCATHRASGTAYIGLTTKGLDKRKRQHLKLAKTGEGHYVHRAIAKYGTEAFDWSVIFHSDDKQQLAAFECEEISRRRAAGHRLYNMTDGGDGTHGWAWTPEIGARMSAAQKRRCENPDYIEELRRRATGKPNTDAQRAKISAALKGRPKSAEARSNIAAGKTGKKFSEAHCRSMSLCRVGKGRPSLEARAKISATMKGRKKSPEAVINMRAARLRWLEARTA